MLAMAAEVFRQTGMRRLVLAGGVALNCVANGRLLREGPFDDIWIQPAAGDAGGSLGARLFVWHQLLDKPRVVNGHDTQKGSLLGPRFTTKRQCVTGFDKAGVPYLPRVEPSGARSIRSWIMLAD
jgi:carbamoyltransferase